MPSGVQLVAGLRVGSSCWFVWLLTRCNMQQAVPQTHTHTDADLIHAHTQEQLQKCNQAETFVDALAEKWKTLPDPFMAFAILNFCKFLCPSWQVASECQYASSSPSPHLHFPLPHSMADVDKLQHLMQQSCHSPFSFISAYFESNSLKTNRDSEWKTICMKQK